jgi:hypothetical protein
MSSALALALTALTAQHNSELAAQEASKTDTIVIRNAEPKAKGKKQAMPSKGEQAAPIHDGPKVFGVTMPERNSLDAKGYLLAMRNAGKRVSDKGIPFTDPKEIRNDQIKAIHAYCGYDTHGTFGGQEMLATAKANRELSGKPIVVGPSREELKSAARSAAGFVHGLPDYKQRALLNLQGREREAVDAMIQHVKDARNKSRPIFDRKLSIGLARVEKERLEQIRSDIRGMRF